MNIKNLYAALFVGIIIAAGCDKKPTACFDASKTTAAVNELIAFTFSCSKNMHDCEFDFGDGAKSTDANPSHAYTVAGSYKVQMMIMTKKNKMDQLSKTITIQ